MGNKTDKMEKIETYKIDEYKKPYSNILTYTYTYTNEHNIISARGDAYIIDYTKYYSIKNEICKCSVINYELYRTSCECIYGKKTYQSHNRDIHNVVINITLDSGKIIEYIYNKPPILYVINCKINKSYLLFKKPNNEYSIHMYVSIYKNKKINKYIRTKIKIYYYKYKYKLYIIKQIMNECYITDINTYKLIHNLYLY